MKNDTTFVRMRSGDHLGDAKCRKKAPRSVEFNFLLIAIDTNGFCRMKEGQIYLIVTIICEYKILRFGDSDDFAGINFCDFAKSS